MLEFREFLHGAEQVARCGRMAFSRMRLIADERIGGGDSLHRGIEMMEELVGDAGGNFGAVSPAQRVFVGNQRAVGFLTDAAIASQSNGFRGAQVDQFDADVMLTFQLLRGLQRARNHAP